MPPSSSRQPPGCLFSSFFFIGIGLFFFLAWSMAVPGLRSLYFFVEAPCTVLDTRILEQDNAWQPQIHIQYQVNGQVHRLWTYDASGISTGDRAANEAIIAGFVKGQQYPCWYDPADPRVAVLVRGLRPAALVCVFPLIFAAVGAGGLMYTRRQAKDAADSAPREGRLSALIGNSLLAAGSLAAVAFVLAILLALGLFFALGAAGAPGWAVGLGLCLPFVLFTVLLVRLGREAVRTLAQRMPSPERKALQQAAKAEQSRATPAALQALTQASTPKQLAVPPPEGDLPTVPRPPLLLETATTLAVRLRPEGVPASIALGCMTVLTVGWLAFVVPIFISALRARLQGQMDPPSIIIPTLFLLIGLALVGGVLLFIARVRAGRVLMELSAHPLRAGGSYELWARQDGRARVRQVQIHLVCEESATYQQGTTTSTATQVVSVHDLLNWERDPAANELSGGVRCPLVVPPDAMHSFEAKHNKITWRLQLRGRVGPWPLKLTFPVIIYPAAEESHEPA
jgi:hypothetical protein